MESLRSKTIRGLWWSFLQSLGQRGVQFVVGIVLARLLFPEQFGLIGMLLIFMAVAESFTDSGYGAALIQKREATATDICSIFYFNIAVGFAAMGALCLAAPWIAAFYDQPVLVPLTRAMSLVIAINSFSIVQSTILQKQLAFKALTKVSLIASSMSGVIGIGMAMAGFGVWSLVVQQISSALFQTILLWFLNTWRPAWIFSIQSLRQMFGFGSRMLGSGLIDKIFSNIYLIAIGKLYSAADLGYFTRANTIQEVPSMTLSGLVARVSFPVFSAIQDDPERLKRAMKKAVTVLALVNFSAMIGLAVIARPLIIALLTEKWVESIPYLQLLCFCGLLYPMHAINLNLLQALGRSDLFLRLEVIKKILILVSIAVTWQWGINAMILGLLCLSVICYFLNTYYTGILIGYSIREQASDMFPYLMVAVLMGMAVYVAGMFPFPNDWVRLFAQVTIGIAVSMLLCRLFKLQAFMEMWQGCWNRMQLLRVGSAG